MRRILIAAIPIASYSASVIGCSVWPFRCGPKDIQVTSVTDVDFKDQPQLEWVSLKPRPSEIISRIDFVTKTDLLTFAKAHDYHVSFAVGPCSKEGMKQTVGPYGGPFWGRVWIDPGTKPTPEYAAAVAKGPPFTYQVYVKELRRYLATSPMCLTLVGGSMLGGKLRSNVAVIPNDQQSP